MAVAVRRCCRSFPRTGYASLYSQITRAAESVLFNIIEGCGAASQREFARFLDTSIKSAFELEGQLELAKDYRIVTEGSWTTLSTHTIGVRRMLFGLRSQILLSIRDGEQRDASSRRRKPARPAVQRGEPEVPAEQEEVQTAVTRKRSTPNGKPEAW